MCSHMHNLNRAMDNMSVVALYGKRMPNVMLDIFILFDLNIMFLKNQINSSEHLINSYKMLALIADHR